MEERIAERIEMDSNEAYKRYLEREKTPSTLPGYLREEEGILDEEIVPFLVDLNSKGFQTTWSCAGHKEALDWSKGFIHFDSTPATGNAPKWAKKEKSVIKGLARSHGIRDLRFVTNPVFGITNHPEEHRKGITFSPISKNPVSKLYGE